MNNIILFDGECKFCNQSINFFIKKDSNGHLQYASLKGPIGRELLEGYCIDKNIDSMVFIKNGKCYFKSDAVLNICRELNFPWGGLAVFLLIPKSIRNFFYDKLAKYRYKLFGKQNNCQLPSPEIRNRFLD
ncbi:thiol-disulfide oxidoreductase DCC family protein [Bacillus thuringiensis]|uniref:thiol-disulfide oxidoreductase DCC family protein n=1 Tax=Bacillus thuringiensis TaxID=1428 RepID=UPI001EE0CF30|nr:DCC1-like thiol-disulfide oxidoreductase family protein [Bacillus thuringiensis]MCG3426412.1 DUF393 domain-containing protein [Bacillus thuringiensis]